MRRALACSFMFACLVIGAADAKTYNIKPGPGADGEAQAAFSAVQPGDNIRFDDGRFDLARPLSLSVSGVDIRGKGAEKTVLSFLPMPGEGDGLRVQGDHLQISNLTVEDAKGAAIVAGGSNILVQNVSVRRALGPGVMILGAHNVIVQKSSAQGTLVGFAVQNSSRVDLLENSAGGNGTGIVIVDRPDGSPGGPVRLVRNKINGNSGQGVGVDVIAVKDVGIFENEIGEHGTANIFVRAFGEDGANATFVALPRNITITKNKFGRAGFSPAQDWAAAAAGGAVFGDIVWDGARSYVAGGRPQSAPVLFAIEDNSSTATGKPRFLSLGLEVAGSPASEASPSTQWPLIARFPPPAEAEIE